jgi:cytochrome b subunit of formate dehydrogenase
MLFCLIRAAYLCVYLLHALGPPHEQALRISHDHHGVLVEIGHIARIEVFVMHALPQHILMRLSISTLPVGVLK